VQIAFLLLIVLIGVSPVFCIINGPIIHGLLSAYAALAVAIVGLSIRPGEAGYLSQIIRPIFVLAIAPAIWMLIQILPIPISSLVHPIWTSAEAALHDPVIGSISIDRGATFLALINYCFGAGVFFVALAVTIDRVRAKFVLFGLASITTFAAVMLIGYDLGSATLFTDITRPATRDSLIALAALGVIINAAAVDYVVERYETRRATLDVSFSRFVRALVLCLSALAICLIAIIIFTRAPVIFATTSGFATFVIIVIIRRLEFDLWVNAVIAVIAVTALIIAIAIIFTNSGSADFTLQFTSAPRPLIRIVQSVLSDTSRLGNGAGTFASLLPIYQNIDRISAGPYAPTTAATIAIEMGHPALWVALTIVMVLFVQIFRGALQRGRDSFYSAAGAGCILLMTVEAFCDATLFATTTVITAAVILGLAFAQSVSRTNQIRFGLG
jgi:hypothetical protein